MTAAEGGLVLSAAPIWTSRVLCRHRAVLGRSTTVAASTAHEGCEPVRLAGRSTDVELGVHAATPTETEAVVDAVRAVLAAAPAGLPVASLLVRTATHHRLPSCSIVLADGDQLAALSWGLPLGVVELGGWEYAVAGSPTEQDAPWTPLSTGTVVALDGCGPVYFPMHPPRASADVPQRQELA